MNHKMLFPLCMSVKWIGLLLILSHSVTSAEVTCKDMKDNPVEWFIVYKMPDGVNFYYMDVNTPSWTAAGKVTISSMNQAIAYTLQQVYKQTEELLYVMYNDEHPDGHQSDSYGHTKGVLASDQSSGFWFIHSVPQFPPPANQSYAYPESGTRYGQTCLCISLPYEQINTVGELYTYNHPSVYDYNIPSAMTGDVPNLVAIATKKYHVKSPPWNITRVLTSTGGQKFQAFAKYTKFYKDLYAAWLAPYYQSDLLVETWQLGTGKLNSSCDTKYKVYNNNHVKVGATELKETQDHSKWAVTASPGIAVTCIGDINRESAQFHRGGGTVCMDMPQVHTVFKNTVIDYELCPGDLLFSRQNLV